MSEIIDARGKACPTPVIMAKKAISAGESTFTVLVDNTTAVENLKRLAANQGFDAAVAERAGEFDLTFTRAGCPACEEAVHSTWPLSAPAAPPARRRSIPPCQPPAATGRCLWAGTSWATGTGSWAPT